MMEGEKKQLVGFALKMLQGDVEAVTEHQMSFVLF